MNRLIIKNLIVFSFAAILVSVVIYLIWERDNRIVRHMEHFKQLTDSIYTTADERATARQFSDSILPALKQKGLIISYDQSELITYIIVSKTLWKERSQFFKENFLNHLSVYNKVHGFSESIFVVDSTGRLLALVLSSERKEFYE